MQKFTVSVSVSLEVHTCSCGLRYAAPEDFFAERKKDGKTFYCPQGCARHYGDSAMDVLKRERDRLKQDAARLDDERRAAEYRALVAERERARVVKRATAALCPCCNRSFLQLARHMKTKHPDVVALPIRKVP